jgi:hypothetical protein
MDYLKIAVMAAVVLLIALGCIFEPRIARARDPDGRFANSPLRPWFDSLKSGKGPCCSDADGTVVADPDWRSKDGHYQVRLPSFSGVGEYEGKPEWIDVPDEAIITEPNRFGRTMVWPIRGYMGTTIRCFMVGPGA